MGWFLRSKTAACGDSGDLRVLVAGMEEGAFGDSDFFSAARVSEANLVASGESGLWALSTLCFAGMKVAAVGESGAEIDELREVDEIDEVDEIGEVDDTLMFITMTDSAAMSVVV